MYIIKLEQGLEHLPEAKEVRIHVFVEEQGFQNEFDEIDAHAYHVVIYDQGRGIATGRTYRKDEDTYALGRIAVEKDYRGKQLGRLIIEQLEEKLAQLGVRYAILSAQTQVRGFYEKLGYEAVGEEYLDEHCPHIDMRKDLYMKH